MWDWDRFGRNQFLGEVRLPLSSHDPTNSRDQWYPLQDKVGANTKGEEELIRFTDPILVAIYLHWFASLLFVQRVW